MSPTIGQGASSDNAESIIRRFPTQANVGNGLLLRNITMLVRGGDSISEVYEQSTWEEKAHEAWRL